MGSGNRFFIWGRGDPAAAEFHPTEFKRTHPRSDAWYFCGVLEELDRRFADNALKFLMTWNLDLFDGQFDDAVVILIGDEMYQTPSYISRVKAVFKTGGLRRNALGATLRLPPSIAARVALRDLRNGTVKMRRRLRGGKIRGRPAPMFELPLGTFSIEDVPFVPVGQREVDVFFSGAIPPGGKKSLRPSIAARLQMAAALRQAEQLFPQRRFVHALTLRGSDRFGPGEYSRNMMNAKIALCPRGNFDETFRLFEAAKSGCVIIAEPLPKRWYYVNAPVVEIRGWKDLAGTLQKLFDDPGRMENLSERTRRWWEQNLAETAVAGYVAASLAGSH